MGKKTTKSTFIPAFNSLQHQIESAESLASSNPIVSIDWMIEAKEQIISPVTTKMWNKAAKRINSKLDNIESSKFYIKEDFWGRLIKPKRLYLIEEDSIFEETIEIHNAIND